jgi:ribosomal protein L37AE/L43A
MESVKRCEPVATGLLRACDLCRESAVLRWLDYDYWACEKCRRLYLAMLRLRG